MKWRFFPVKKFEIILPEGTDAYKSLSENTEKSKISMRIITFKAFLGEVEPQKFRITLSEMLGGGLSMGAPCVMNGEFDENKIIFSIEVYKPFKILTYISILIPVLLWFYQIFTRINSNDINSFTIDFFSLAFIVVLTKILWEIDCWISLKIIFHRMKKFLDVVEIKKLS